MEGTRAGLGDAGLGDVEQDSEEAGSYRKPSGALVRKGSLDGWFITHN